MATHVVGKADLLTAANASFATLGPLAEADWTVKAGEIDLTCRDTVDHIIGALVNYSSNLAMRSTHPLPRVRSANTQASIADLTTSVVTAATILAELVDAAPANARGFHPLGSPDPAGYAAMGCNEILVHTADIAMGLGVPFDPPNDLCARITTRLFPWAPSDLPGWEIELWCNGRIALPGHPRLEPDWSVQCAPLSEWDGKIKKRSLT